MVGLRDDEPVGFGGIVGDGRPHAPADRELKMWLVVREDLKMSKGKAMVQAGHAFQWHAVQSTLAASAVFAAYMDGGSTPKVCVRVKDLPGLEKVEIIAAENGLTPVKVEDLGRTEFDGPTVTCVVFGPAYRDDLPPFLKRLQLLKDEGA